MFSPTVHIGDLIAEIDPEDYDARVAEARAKSADMSARADAAQRTAIEVLLGGKAGGPWGVLGWTWPKVHGPYAASYDLAFDGVKTRRTTGTKDQVEAAEKRWREAVARIDQLKKRFPHLIAREPTVQVRRQRTPGQNRSAKP